MMKETIVLTNAAPTNTVENHHVFHLASATACASPPTANSTTPSTPTTSDGVYPYMMMVASPGPRGFGNEGSI